MSKIFTWILMFGNLITCKICIATINQNTWLNRTLISHPLILPAEENEAQMGKIKRWTDGFFSRICESEDLHLLMSESTQWSVTFAYTRVCESCIYHSIYTANARSFQLQLVPYFSGHHLGFTLCLWIPFITVFLSLLLLLCLSWVGGSELGSLRKYVFEPALPTTCSSAFSKWLYSHSCSISS